MEGISQEAISLAGHLKLGQADRAVRRQLHLDRRGDLAGRVGRPGEALRGLRLGGDARRRPRSRRDRQGDRGGARLRPADADRLQDHHRLRRADQAGQGVDARRAARRRRDQGRAREARLGACRLRGAGRRAGGLARGRRARRRVSARPGSSARPSSRRSDAARSDRQRRRPRPSRLPIAAIKAEFAAAPPKLATRQSSQKVLEKLVPVLPALIGGSADLTGSNSTPHQASHGGVAPADFAGNYIHYGVREHGMAAAMNGMALHGGIVPYGGTFLVFTDYCRPVDPAVGADGPARHLRHDARLDRPRRGRPDAPAGRAPGGAARDAEPQRVPPGRRGRDGGVLGAGAAGLRHAVDPGADAAGAADAAHRGTAARTCPPRAPTCWPRPAAASAT